VTTNVTYRYKFKLYAGADLRWGSGARAPRFTCCTQMQKVADRSHAISEVLKFCKMQIFGPAGGTYSAPPDALADSEGARCFPRKNPTPARDPLGLVSTGLWV